MHTDALAERPVAAVREQARRALARQADADLETRRATAGGNALARVEHVRQETDILTGSIDFPPTRVSFRDRHVLIVVRGERHRRDLKALRTYIRNVRPLIVAVDGGADGVLEAGLKPDMILGDMDSASDSALGCGAGGTCTLSGSNPAGGAGGFP